MRDLSQKHSNLIWKILAALCIFMLLLDFYILIVNSGITAHDDLNFFYQARSGKYWEFMNETFLTGRLGNSLTQFPTNFVQFLTTNAYQYRAFTMLGIVIAIYSMYCFCKKMLNKKIAVIASVLFIQLAQLTFDMHCGFLSFGWSFQMSIAFVFFSLNCFYNYLETGKYRWNIVASILFVISVMFYEAFFFYCPLFLALCIWKLREKKECSFFNIVKKLWLIASGTLLYLILYYFFKINAPLHYIGSSIAPDILLSERLNTIKILGLGLSPLRQYTASIGKFWGGMFRMEPKVIFIWLENIFCCLIIGYCIINSKKISGKKYIAFLIFALLSVFLPVIPYGLTFQYTYWVNHQGVASYMVSYYSYFAIIIFITCLLLFLYQKVIKSKVVVGLLLAVICILGVRTRLDNAYYATNLKASTERYVLFDKMVSSKYFMENVEDGAQILAPEQDGIHNDLASLSNYANIYTKKQYTFVKDIKDIHLENGPAYYMSCNNMYHCIFIIKINPDYLADELYVIFEDEASTLMLEGMTETTGQKAYMDGKAAGEIKDAYYNMFLTEGSDNDRVIRIDNMQVFKTGFKRVEKE